MRARKTKKWWRGEKLYNCPPWKYIIFGRTRRCFRWHNSLAFILADIKWQKKKLSFILTPALVAVDFHKFANTNLSVSIQVCFLNHSIDRFLWNCCPHPMLSMVLITSSSSSVTWTSFPILCSFPPTCSSTINLDISAFFLQSNINKQTLISECRGRV